MHVENQVQSRAFAPSHHRVDAGKAVLVLCQPHIVFIGEEFVIKGESDRVGALRSDKLNVGARDVVVLEQLPELGGKIRTYSLLNHQVDHPGGVGAAEPEHITFGVEPVAQVCALDIQFRPVGLHQVWPVDLDKVGGLGGENSGSHYGHDEKKHQSVHKSLIIFEKCGRELSHHPRPQSWLLFLLEYAHVVHFHSQRKFALVNTLLTAPVATPSEVEDDVEGVVVGPVVATQATVVV